MDVASLAIIMIFGMPVFLMSINRIYKYKAKRLELEHKALPDPEQRQKLLLLEQDRAQLLDRVENLETIVTSVDMELNARLNRLSAQQSFLALPPAGGAARVVDPAVAAGTAPTYYPQEGPTKITTGTVLMKRFEVERPLGRGGMGAVFLATDRKIGEQVALKVIASNLAEDPSAAERFRREVGAARKITHVNVIRIHDLEEDGRLLFLSMEYFPGMDLEELLSRRGELPLVEVRPILVQICDALSAAHRVGVIHRDLKPGNVLINEQGEVRVIDFGLAKASYMHSMTATGLIMGTPEYMAPEQVRGRTTDHRTDIYALGALAYHLLCGEVPFKGDTPIAVGFQHCAEPPRPPRQLKPDLPEALEAAVLKCLEKDPAARFDSVAEFKKALV